MSMGQLEGQTAVITGASDGIGLASACSLARDGAAVVIMARGEEALARARSSILAESPGARVEMVVGDACDEAAVKDALARAHASTGRLDMVIATVGGADFKLLLLRELADVREEMDRNFTSAFLMARHGAPLMQNGGAIVCISTAAVVQSYWGLSIYAAAKAAVERFVRSAALELGGAGIRINAVRPGSTFPTERSEAPEFREIVDYYAGQTPLGRIGRPEDIARVVRFLAGPDSGWVTGQTFSADGGQDQCTAPELMEPLYGKAVMDQVRAGRIPGPA